MASGLQSVASAFDYSTADPYSSVPGLRFRRLASKFVVKSVISTSSSWLWSSLLSSLSSHQASKLTRKTLEEGVNCSKSTIKTPKQRHWRFSKICIVNFEQISHPVLVFLLLTLNRQMSTGITTIPIFSWENFIFCRISTELLMENRTKVIDDYLSNLKLTVSKAGLKMLCHVVLTSTIHCMTKIISIHCDMSDELRGVFDLRDLWGFSVPYIFVTFSIMPPRPLKAIYHQFIIKNICINKRVPRKPAIRSTGFSKPKINLLYCKKYHNFT